MSEEAPGQGGEAHHGKTFEAPVLGVHSSGNGNGSSGKNGALPLLPRACCPAFTKHALGDAPSRRVVVDVLLEKPGKRRG